MPYERQNFKRLEILRGKGRFLVALVSLSCICFLKKGMIVKAVLTRTTSTYKRHHTDISGNKSHSSSPLKRIKVREIMGSTFSPLKRSIKQVQGGVSGGAPPRKRMAYSFPQDISEGIDRDDPNIWFNYGMNVFGDEDVFISYSTPELTLVTSYGDFTYNVTDKNGKSKIVSISEDGSGWFQGRDIIWTDD